LHGDDERRANKALPGAQAAWPLPGLQAAARRGKNFLRRMLGAETRMSAQGVGEEALCTTQFIARTSAFVVSAAVAAHVRALCARIEASSCTASACMGL